MNIGYVSYLFRDDTYHTVIPIPRHDIIRSYLFQGIPTCLIPRSENKKNILTFREEQQMFIFRIYGSSDDSKE